MFKVEQLTLQCRIGAVLIAVLLSLGLVFRWVNLDRKVFWVDEVATAVRVAGYTKQEVTESLAGGSHTPAALLAYQRINPNRSWLDTVAALQQSPEHAPLYFLLLRLWTQVWGSSVTAIRSFSVVCGLLLLLGGYGLSRALFDSASSDRPINSAWISAIVVASMSISPVLIAYSQEARPYSLWLLTLTLSGITLLRALRTDRLAHWAVYALALGASVYTSFLSVSVAIGQGIYVVALERGLTQRVRRFAIVIGCVIAALLPWLWLIVQRWQTLQDNTTWMRIPIPHFAKIIIWFYSIAILYFDVPVILQPRIIAVAEVVTASGVVAVVVYALYSLCQSTPTRIWLFVLSLALPIPLMLVLIDLISNGRYSTAPRYLLPFHLGSQLAIAYLLSSRLRNQTVLDKAGFHRRKWQGIAVFLVAVSLLSNLIHLETSPRYLKNRNLHNSLIATIINQTYQPVLVSESQNTIDLLSLSHTLDPDTQIKILPLQGSLLQGVSASEPDVNQLMERSQSCHFLFNPSDALQQQIQQDKRLQLEALYRPQVLIPTEFALSLWRLCSRSVPNQP